MGRRAQASTLSARRFRPAPPRPRAPAAPPRTRGAGETAAVACLRRARLLALVAGGIEVAHGRRRPIRDVLALEDEALLHAVSGGTGVEALRERLAAGSAFALLAAAGEARVEVLCRHTADYPARLADDRAAPAALFVRAGEAGRAR